MEIKKKNEAESDPNVSNDKPSSVINETDKINELKRAVAYNLFYNQGTAPITATLNDYYMAVAHTVRDRMQHLFVNSVENLRKKKHVKIVSYLSAEFLMGPQLANNLINLGLYDLMNRALQETGLDIEEIINHEVEPGLGNGGLGRLAACYLDSLATLQVPAIGYGIRYEYGMFNQEIIDGWQRESSDRWLHQGNPWEIKKPDVTYHVKFGGHTEFYTDEQGHVRVRWIPGRVVNGVAYDTPVPGYRVNTVNFLRLWSAVAPQSFDFEDFNRGDYFGAVQGQGTGDHGYSSGQSDKPIPGRERLHYKKCDARQDQNDPDRIQYQCFYAEDKKDKKNHPKDAEKPEPRVRHLKQDGVKSENEKKVADVRISDVGQKSSPFHIRTHFLLLYWLRI